MGKKIKNVRYAVMKRDKDGTLKGRFNKFPISFESNKVTTYLNITYGLFNPNNGEFIVKIDIPQKDFKITNKCGTTYYFEEIKPINLKPTLIGKNASELNKKADYNLKHKGQINFSKEIKTARLILEKFKINNK